MQLPTVLCHNYLTSLELNISFNVLAVPLELAIDRINRSAQGAVVGKLVQAS